MTQTLEQLLPSFLMPMVNSVMPYYEMLMQYGEELCGSWWSIIVAVVWALIKIMILVAVIMGIAAYATLAERKIMGAIQFRIGPNRVGPWGLLQPVADGLKAMLKEIVIPVGADKVLFLLAPVISFSTALLAWAVVPFNDFLVVANVDASLLFVLAITSLSVYGIMLGGWSSNSKYPFLGSMRCAAQLISYEVPMGLSLIAVLMVSNSLNLIDIVNAQKQGMFADLGLGFLSWNWLPLLPMFGVYMVCIIAEANRTPFDLAEGESEIVGYHAEYSGMAYAIFMVSEYLAMFLCSLLAAILFLGGWLSPVGFLPDSVLWLVVKAGTIITLYIWLRSTFPRYRYDQVMRLGWKIFIPLCLIWIAVIGCWMMSPWNIWK